MPRVQESMLAQEVPLVCQLQWEGVMVSLLQAALGFQSQLSRGKRRLESHLCLCPTSAFYVKTFLCVLELGKQMRVGVVVQTCNANIHKTKANKSVNASVDSMISLRVFPVLKRERESDDEKFIPKRVSTEFVEIYQNKRREGPQGRPRKKQIQILSKYRH